MRRDITEDDLQRFVDGQLSADRLALVRQYLAEHPEARRRVDADLRCKRAVRRHVAEQVDRVDDPVTAGLATELAARLELSTSRRPSPWWRQTAAAVVLFSAGWGASLGYDAYRAWAVPPVVNGAAKAHQIFAETNRRPVELAASDSLELKHWFSEHLYASVDIPQLEAIGLTFMGGRLLATEQGPLAQMLYEDYFGRRLSFYISPADAYSGADVQVVKVGGFRAGYWEDEGLVYTLVADTTREQLLTIAAVIGGDEPTYE
ncbi:anti-sigma factor RsiW [Natronocella acetinitrilica]|uniref:Anti-sigma factor RsiW n=1 Tax=Natronocella acetinitrilica TaxID=414046 RepID=A0AAE3G2Y7_9GAMM|nr:anti-sigma factor [Natronocella acetinitrilica]MCP1674836.1 anti-sigma factor RsiW [Natronocella acetinitrilica]